MRYASMGGTAQAAAFVSAAAARVWGYLPNDNATAIVQRLQATGNALSTGGTCWPSPEPSSLKMINVANAMDRGAIQAYVYDAVTHLPIPGAKIMVYTSKNVQVGSAVIPTGPILDVHTGLVNQSPTAVDILNLPAFSVSGVLTAKVSATNYTVSPQNAFVGPDQLLNAADGTFSVMAGIFSDMINAYVPPKTANFAVIGEALMGGKRPYIAAWVPMPPASPGEFIVSGTYAYANPTSLALPYGSMNADPYARWMDSDTLFYESLLIRPRASNSKAPWYVGTYWVGITDGYTSGTNYMDNRNVSMLVWKDGAIKIRVNKGSLVCNSNHWWYPLQIISPASGSATYTLTPAHCGTINDAPYHP